MLIVIALAYVLFAVMAERWWAIIIESSVASGVLVVSVAAARWADVRTAAFVVAFGLVAHGGYDLVHPFLVTNPVVPTWWPLFCGVVDIALGGWVLGVVRCEAVTGRDAA